MTDSKGTRPLSVVAKEPNPAIIASLERALADARAGRITAMVFVAIANGGDLATAHQIDSSVEGLSLVGALELVKRRILEAVG